MTSSPAAPSTVVAMARARERWRTLGCRLGALLVLAVALADFFRWHAHPAKWARLDAITPMPPGLAGGFILLGAALGLHLLFPARRGARRIALAFSALSVAIALHVLVERPAGQTPVWEAWLGADVRVVNGFSAGHISVQEAILVLLSTVALIGLSSLAAGRAWTIQVGICSALLVELFAVLAVLSYAAGNSAVSNEGWLKVPPLVMAEFGGFNLLLLSSRSATEQLHDWYFGGNASAPVAVAREKRLVLLLVAGVGVLAVTGGLLYLRLETARCRARSIETLQTITYLKISQIEQWRHERFADARTLMQNPGVGGNLSTLAAPEQAAERARFTAWLLTYVRSHGYTNIVVFDAALDRVLSEPGAVDYAEAETGARLRELRPDSDVVELPPYVDRTGHLRWDLLVPLTAVSGGGLSGAILLQADPSGFLLPILQLWPPDNLTGQSALWGRVGDSLALLGGYREAPGVTPNQLRPFGIMQKIATVRPLSPLDLGLRGTSGVWDDADFRGVKVIGLGGPVRNSPWLYASRVEAGEVYAPVRRTAFGVAGLVMGLFGSTGLAMSSLWRRRQQTLWHERVTAELEQRRLTARLGLVMRHAKDVILLTDENMRLIEANQQATDTYGWNKDRLLRMSIPELSAAESGSEEPAGMARVNSPGGVIFETTHRRQDGTTFPVEISVRRVEIDGQPQALYIIRDITERRQAEQRLSDSHAQLRVLAGHLQKVREEESRRIARAVHDEVGQLLTGIKMDLRWIEQSLEKHPTAHSGVLLDKVVEVTVLVDETVVTVQRIAAELRPAILDQLGLFAALRLETAQFQKRAGVTCRLIAPEPEPRLPPDLATTCYRITQEALTNVARHAGATLVEIEFRQLRSEWVLEVRDNGCGIPPNALQDVHSHGLFGMQERARSHDGEVFVVPGAAGGTIVQARFPHAEGERKMT